MKLENVLNIVMVNRTRHTDMQEHTCTHRLQTHTKERDLKWALVFNALDE